jgi:protein-S-isoprenylcysteine O-methyltransferase Ste14
VRRLLQGWFDGQRKENVVTPPPWINAAIRSVIWLGGAGGLAYFKKPDGASVLAVRPDAIGWLAGSICVAGLALHIWSNVSLARGERQATGGASPLVMDGPFRYVRNPIYLAGIALLLGVGLLYPTWEAKDLVLTLVLLVYFHWAVVRVEEPALQQQFGPAYEEYCRRVARWLPAPTSLGRASRQNGAAGGSRPG